ncbi:MAG TPA: SDR family oxidoreductase [Candidatus Sulfotelmatobacter sp.]|jgi:nucleoside-diphosphate-sugar epimerase|nr:SDR family oxidoreductase [Candidatus Sulfotelmatobacter sp.]
MRIFLTGATGFIGSHLTSELIRNGHDVLGLTRSEAGAQALRRLGAQTHHGSLEDLDSLKRGGAASDAVVHCAYDHDFSRSEAIAKLETDAIRTLGAAVAGSQRPLIITSVCAMGAVTPGEPATEDGYNVYNPRKSTEDAGRAAAEQGANVSVVRLAQVHNTMRQGFVSGLVAIARERGLSAYVGASSSRWAAVNVLDAARLYRLAVEKAAPGAVYHAVGDEGVPLKNIAETIGQRFGIPVQSITAEEAKEHFGWLAMFVAMDMAASSQKTQALLDWHPQGAGLLEDLRHSEVS